MARPTSRSVTKNPRDIRDLVETSSQTVGRCWFGHRRILHPLNASGGLWKFGASVREQSVGPGQVADQHQLHRQIISGRRQSETDAGLDGDGIAGIIHNTP